MEQDPELTKKTEKILADISKIYGTVPLTSQMLSERPEHFLPSSALSASVFEKNPAFDAKTCHLIALAAAAAQGAQYCMRAQMADAVRFGATEDEVFETLEIASYMCMTRSQSYSFRVFAEQFGKDTKKK